MSERMNQHEFDEQRAALVRSAARWRYAGRIVTEAERARASEEQKDAVIKALNEELAEMREAAERHADQQSAVIKVLADVLEPFAKYAARREAKPLKGLGDEIHTIHFNTEWEATIRLSDCHKAIAALRLAGRLP